MKLEIPKLIDKLRNVGSLLRHHLAIFCIVLFGMLYCYILLQASKLTNQQPEQAKVTEKLQAVPRPKVDKQVAETMQGLEDRNVNVQAIFKDARDNPFNE